MHHNVTVSALSALGSCLMLWHWDIDIISSAFRLDDKNDIAGSVPLVVKSPHEPLLVVFDDLVYRRREVLYVDDFATRASKSVLNG